MCLGLANHKQEAKTYAGCCKPLPTNSLPEPKAALLRFTFPITHRMWVKQTGKHDDNSGLQVPLERPILLSRKNSTPHPPPHPSSHSVGSHPCAPVPSSSAVDFCTRRSQLWDCHSSYAGASNFKATVSLRALQSGPATAPPEWHPVAPCVLKAR